MLKLSTENEKLSTEDKKSSTVAEVKTTSDRAYFGNHPSQKRKQKIWK